MLVEFKSVFISSLLFKQIDTHLGEWDEILGDRHHIVKGEISLCCAAIVNSHIQIYPYTDCRGLSSVS